MIFSAVGVMVIYLNVPTANAPVLNTLPSDPAPIIQANEDQGATEKVIVDEEWTPLAVEPLLDGTQPTDESLTPPTAEANLPPADTLPEDAK